MVVTYYGASCFKIQSGDMVLAFDPPSKKSDFKPPRFQADVVFVSHDHPNHSGYDNLHGKEEKEPFLINGPGEYEVGKVPARGIKTFHDAASGAKYGLNTVYLAEIEGANVCHLGDFGEKELRPEVQEALGEVDVLFLPVAGSVADIEHAVKLVSQIEPSIVIPMHYFTKDGRLDKKLLAAFLKEMGQEKVQPLDRFTFRKKEIMDKKEEVVVLTPLF